MIQHIRYISKLQEQIYRACHHEHKGMSVEEASDVYAIPEPTIERILAEVEDIAPQLFPILSASDWGLWQGWLRGDTVKALTLRGSCSERTVSRRIADVKKQLNYARTPTRVRSLNSLEPYACDRILAFREDGE
ncbi:hypothetical protein LCGC14_0561430 [marine sediment metagenome]|uniref:Uncharacterized protein n=1 Tax=marine sediment metagenome TaxID=412755 RepID=A0A0F9U8D6_9ZZZZ